MADRMAQYLEIISKTFNWVRRIVDEKEYRKAQWQFWQISGLISVGRENNLFGVICDNVFKDTK